MDIQQVYSVEIRAEGSDKTLVLIDQLTEAESDKVFKRITFPTRGEGYEKVYIYKEMVLRRMALEGK